MSVETSPPADLRLVVGFDGSPPATRALEAAVRLLAGRTGRVTVLYVAHLTSTEMLSADAIAQIESDFDQIEQELRAEAAERLRDRVPDWDFERRQGPIGSELISAAMSIHAAHPHDYVTIVVGSSSSAMHRIVGSVAVSLARHSPVPLVVVP